MVETTDTDGSAAGQPQGKIHVVQFERDGKTVTQKFDDLGNVIEETEA